MSRRAADASAHETVPRRANSSLGGLVGLPGRASYHASKHGVLGLTKSAALEYAPRGVRINAVCPRTIDKPMVARMIEKGELDMAEAIKNQPIGRRATRPRSRRPSSGSAALP